MMMVMMMKVIAHADRRWPMAKDQKRSNERLSLAEIPETRFYIMTLDPSENYTNINASKSSQRCRGNLARNIRELVGLK